MRHIFLLMTLFSLAFLGCQNNKSDKVTTKMAGKIEAHTSYANSLYELSIDQSKISKPHETDSGYYPHGFFITVPLKLYNHSNDTLKYTNMSCSNFEIYNTDNSNMKVMPQNCDSNFPVVLTVAPHSWSITVLQILFNSVVNNYDTKFKIGMHLQQYLHRNQLFDFENFQEMTKQKSNLIWSNTVKIP